VERGKKEGGRRDKGRKGGGRVGQGGGHMERRENGGEREEREENFGALRQELWLCQELQSRLEENIGFATIFKRGGRRA
jgi:hypothetical protein